MEQILPLLEPLFVAYVGKLGWAVQLVAVVGTMHLAVAPLVDALKSGIKFLMVLAGLTKTKKDDLLLQKVDTKLDMILKSKSFGVFNYVLKRFSGLDLSKK